VVILTLRPLYFGLRATTAHWLGNWVGPGAGLGVFLQTHLLFPTMNRNTIIQPVG